MRFYHFESWLENLLYTPWLRWPLKILKWVFLLMVVVAVGKCAYQEGVKTEQPGRVGAGLQ